MDAADHASWLGQIQRDRARRLELDVTENDIRRRRPHVDLQDDDNLEENREPPPEVKSLTDIFPGVSAALLIRVFERKLKATELIRFKEKSVTELGQEGRVFKMTESGGTVGFKKAAASLKDWGPNPQIWTICFLAYLAVAHFARNISATISPYLRSHQQNLQPGLVKPGIPDLRITRQSDTGNVVLNPLSLSLTPQGQPPRPNTAIQYPVFNPELPRLQSSPSPLDARGWSNLLRYYPGDLGFTIAGILTYGAQVGYRGKKRFRYSSNHHIHEPGIIKAQLAEDLNLGRVRLASRPSFVSPLGLVLKHDGGWRRIHDLSWPPGQGLNQGIPGSWSAIEYIPTSRSYKLAEDNQHLLAFQWNGSTYVECCLPFGLATAPFLFNLFTEAFHWILQCHLPAFHINHYLDDFIVIARSPSVSEPTGPFDEVYNRVADYLRIPRNTKKDQQGTCVTVLGIQIDSIAMEARLAPGMLCRATLDAAACLTAVSLSLKQTERLAGLLAFCSRVFRLGRTRLQSLYSFQAAFPHRSSARRRFPYEVRDDLEWWRDSLSPFNGVLLIDPCRRTITHLYTDASSIGQGLFFFSSKSTLDCWLAHCHQLHQSNAATLALAQDAHAHINTQEVDAILQGFLLFSHHWLHHTLVIHTDSSTAHMGLKKGFLHGPPNAPLKSLLILGAARDIHIVPRWLPSRENTLADALSRNNLEDIANICPHWQDLSVLNRPRGSLHELLSSMQAT
ncbi:hypothetical protein N7451_012516 [Penicillium sp. IBT 35674x]|nr:hypothetical protein N7451_012516 [Penicillium sp. IBT 35674x]